MGRVQSYPGEGLLGDSPNRTPDAPPARITRTIQNEPHAERAPQIKLSTMELQQQVIASINSGLPRFLPRTGDICQRMRNDK